MRGPAGTSGPVAVLTMAVGLAACVQPTANASDRRDWSHGRTRRLALFSSEFAGSAEGWGLEAEAPGSAPAQHVAPLRAEGRALVAADKGPATWYLVTPESWGGDQSAAYNGEVFFRLWHPEQPAAGTAPARVGPADGTKRIADIIIESTCGFSVRLYNFFPAPRVASTVYSIPISEEAASWIDSRTNRRITQLDMLVTLSHFRVLKIRGGFLVGAEMARLAEFRIVPPAEGMVARAHLEPCCTPLGRMAVCQRTGPRTAGSSHHPEVLSFPGLGFECGGSLVSPASRPRVRHVYPRSSRRSGGARITVFGENFGLHGKSFARLAGKKAARCHFPKAQHCTNGILDWDEKNVDCGGLNCPPCTYLHPHCSNGLLDYDEDKLDCGGKDCERCATMTLVSHCTNGIRDFDEVAIDRGGADCLPNFCFDFRLTGDKRDPVKNCGGSCQPCFPRSVAPADNGKTQLAICDAPGDLDLDDAQVSFTRVDPETLHETSSCFNDDAEARGFVFDGFDNAWSLHMASLDGSSQTDVNVTGIAIDDIMGDSYVTASVTRIFKQGDAIKKGDGKMTVMGSHLDKRGFTQPGVPPIGTVLAKGSPTYVTVSQPEVPPIGVNSTDDFAVGNDGAGNPITEMLIHTVLLKVNIYGVPQWLTYMESQYTMVVEDILVDTTARPSRIIIAGIFKGYFPRFYLVNPLTKRAKRGSSKERDGGLRCSNMSVVNIEDCWYFQGTPNYDEPPEKGLQQLAKPGIFIVSYNQKGIPTDFKGGIYFKSTGASFPLEGTVRIAAHTTAIRTAPTSGSYPDHPSSYVDDFNGLYLSAKVLVSRYKDTMYFGEQTSGYSRFGKDGCINIIDKNGGRVCEGGTDSYARDVLRIEFPEVLPTPKDDSSWAFIAKFVAGSQGFGTVWVRLIGEIGTNKRTNVAGLKVDRNGVYIAGSFSAGASTNLSYQSCEFGSRFAECEPGGKYYVRGTGLCSLQEAYAAAPNQVCSTLNSSLLDKHVVRTRDFRRFSDTLRQGMFLASYNHKGVLRWHREAVGGNITVADMELSTERDIMDFDFGKENPRRKTRISRRGRFVFVTGLVLQYFGPEEDAKGKVGNIIEFTNFGQMRYPLSCSQNKNAMPESGNSTQASVSVVGDYESGPIYTPCSGRITSLGQGSDIYLVQFSADDGEPQWLKRFGQRDAWDYVADIAINRQHSTIYMTGSYVGSSSGLQDIFSMEAAGRLDVISCPPWSGPRWSTTSNQFEFEHITNESVASCKLEPFSITDPAGARSGFIMEIGEGDTESTGEKPWQTVIREAAAAAQAEQQRKIEELGPTGDEVPIIVPWEPPKKAKSSGVDGSSLPFSQCLEPDEIACNADGILWVRSLHAKGFSSYTRFAPQNPGRKLASGRDYVLVGGLFEGVHVDNTKQPYGLRTHGVDDLGFFNQRVDNVETYLVALAS